MRLLVRPCSFSFVCALVVTTTFSLALPAAAPMPQSPASTIELIAVRGLLAPYRPGLLTIDSIFAHPDQAPPGMTTSIRPAPRQQLLIESLQSLVTRGGHDTLRVRASEPHIRGRTATISVTVDGRLATGRDRSRFYETVAFVLERDGARWLIRSRTQLGVS